MTGTGRAGGWRPPASPLMRLADSAVDRLGLEGAVARLPDRLRIPFAQRRFGWMGFLREVDEGPGDFHSLREPEAANAIFLHVPKNGGVSVAKTLFGSHVTSHTPLFAYLAWYGAARFDAMFKFGFVRDPWKRLSSAFHFLKAGGLTDTDRAWAETHLAAFEDVNDFVQTGLSRPEIATWVHFRPQMYFLRDPRTKRHGLDFTGRFERLEEDFRTVAHRLGQDAALPHFNKTKRAATALDARSIEIIGEIYREDAETFGYRAPET